MRIITAGGSHADIDVYGGIIAYAELLRKQGVEARAVTTAALNDSITPTVRSWDASIDYEYAPHQDDRYTLVDVSEPKYFETFVDLERIDEVIDHHPGFEAFWQERIGERAIIERVGAACTQVFEKWKNAKLLDQISETSARLLLCGILDNTLNFGADITTDRDHAAYIALKQYANLPEDWPAQYFRDCQQAITKDIAGSLQNDTKAIRFKTYLHPAAVGQLALWDGGDIAKQSREAFKQAISAKEAHWFMNAISISEKKSYFVTDVPEMQAWLSGVLGVTFNGDVAEAGRMWLRKEIIKADIDRDKANTYTATVKGKMVNFSHKGTTVMPPFSSVTSVSVIPFTDEGDIVAVQLKHRGLDIPGGHVESGEETPEQTMNREAAEEACITIRDLFLVEVIESDFFEHPSYMLLYGARVDEFHEFKTSDDEISEGRVIISPEKFIEQYNAGDKRLMKRTIEAAWQSLRAT